MRVLAIFIAAMMLAASGAQAADPELSIDSKRMLAFGTLAVMTGACKTPLSPAQAAQIKTGLQKASEAQTQLSQADFTEMMKAAGAQVGSNKEEVCSSLTPEFIAASLEQAEAGE